MDTNAITADADKLAAFIGNGELNKLLLTWSYYMKSNSHQQATASLINIKSILDEASKQKYYHQNISTFYKELLDEPTNSKMCLRALNKKNKDTIIMLGLLEILIKSYDISIFINHFEIPKFLPDLLSKHDSLRFHTLKFWIQLNSKLLYFDRMNNFGSKMWYNTFKFLEKSDEKIIEPLVDFINEKVLLEPSYNKAIKLKFFNEGCLFNLQRNLTTFKLLPTFKQILDIRHGILFTNNNPILLKLLTFIKIDSIEKINLIIVILKGDFKLIDPYMNHIRTSSGYNDPNLTNWYISHNLLYAKILNLPTYDIDNILLKPFSKASLNKGLSFKSDLIIQLNLQIVYLILNKLDHVEKSLISKVFKNLPDVSEILNVSSDNEVITLLKLKILEKYSKFQNIINNALVKFVNDSINSLDLDNKFNLIKLNYLVSIQLNLSNKFTIKSNTLLANLVRFSKVDENYVFYYNLINKLVDIPDITTLNPVYSLLKLKVPDELSNSVNELFTRLNNPYKYLDLPFKVNLFTKILFEQFSIYLNKNPSESLNKWLAEFVSELNILGEDSEELMKLLKHYSLDIQPSFSIISKINIIKNDYELLSVVHNISLTDNIKELNNWYEKLAGYVASNHQFTTYFNRPALFKLFLNGNETKLSLFHDLIKDIEINDSQIRDLIFERLKKNDNYVIFNTVLSNDQLNYKFSERVQLLNFKVLIDRGELPDISLSELFNYEGSIKVLKYMINENNVDQYIEEIINHKLYSLLGTKLNSKSIDYLISLEQSNEVLRQVATFVEFTEELRPFFEKITIDPKSTNLKLIAKLMQVKEIEFDFNIKFEETLNADYITILLKSNHYDSEWLSKSLIYITKMFAENSELDDSFFEFLKSFTNLLPLSPSAGMSNIIGTQLEVFFNSSWVATKYIEYINGLVVSLKGFTVDFMRYLNIFINNDNNVLKGFPTPQTRELRIYSSLVIYNLVGYADNLEAGLMLKLIYFYNGTIFFEDLILKKVLKTLEAKVGENWLNFEDWNWEFNDFKDSDYELIGKQHLFFKTLISVNKRFIKNCLESSLEFDLPDNQSDIVEYINENIFKLDYSYNNSIYDKEFLILLVLNNHEFFKFENSEVSVNYKNLIDHYILQIIIKNFRSLLPMSKVILNNLIKHIESDSGFKDKNVLKIYISSFLNSSPEELTSLQTALYAKILPIIVNPGHFMYDVIIKFVLSTPQIKAKELPFFNKVKLENFRAIEWYLSGLEIQTEDLPAVNSNQFLEWMLNLVNVPNKKLSKHVLRVIFKIPEINHGTLSLVTKYSILSFLELVSRDDTSINLQEISKKLGISASKRVLEWTNEDLLNNEKRLKLEAEA